MIALESADDSEGFSFWLALAEGPAFVYTGQKKFENGRSFVPGGYYITVRYYERFPPSSPSSFQLNDTKWTENARHYFPECFIQCRRGSPRRSEGCTTF